MEFDMMSGSRASFTTTVRIWLSATCVEKGEQYQRPAQHEADALQDHPRPSWCAVISIFIERVLSLGY
jgi:hypothetical protein